MGVHVGEPDCAEQNLGADYVYDGDLNGFEDGNQVQVASGLADDLAVNLEVPIIKTQSDGQGVAGNVAVSEVQQNGVSYSNCQFDSQDLSIGSHDFDDNDFIVQNCEPYEAPDNHQVVVDTIESEQSSCRDEESHVSGSGWMEHDESVALWVKWRGKWQAGIRCARADWPLSTLRAKPTHDRKKYFVVFFPHTRNYSWADMLLVRSINEFPQPIAYTTHKIGLKMVKDLNVARRFIMRKLAVGMLNIIDQLHTEALTETARNVTAWKEFAMEASRCSGYSDLGRMLPKLQNMIFQQYVESDWLEHSFRPWVQRCEVAQSAESVELLREELSDSILWNEVNSLWSVPVQPTLGSEWKTWKHEVMKWFSASLPVSNSGELEQKNTDSQSTMSLQACRKRPKLEVRRAEPHASHVETNSPLRTMNAAIDSAFFINQDSINALAVAPSLSNKEDLREVAAPVESPCSVADRWDDIIVEAQNSEIIHTKDAERTPVSEVVDKKIIDPGNRNRQCTAFIESKGRQCVRWANDGDVYCCVHLASRFIGSSTKAEASPPANSAICEGTTVLGTRCKHRSLPGSSFCKKHGSRSETTNLFNSPENSLKRKHEEIGPGSDITYCKDIVLVGEPECPLKVEPVSVMGGEAFHERNKLIGPPERCSQNHTGAGALHCIGSSPFDNDGNCCEAPKRYSLYCDKHIPSWLKRARNGKSRIVPKEVFIDLLKDCHSLDQKLRLHQASELFYKLFKSILSLRNPVPLEIQLQWALSEASKDFGVGELLLKLVCAEKDRLIKLWGFSTDAGAHVSSSVVEETPVLPLALSMSHDDKKSMKCKYCSEEFVDDQLLGNHCIDNHKKEAQWMFRGYACAICFDSFTNRELLESHVQGSHHVEFVEQCVLLQCIPCGSHFGNDEELWLHVVSVHLGEFRLSKVDQNNLAPAEERDDSSQKLELVERASVETNFENLDGIRKFICKFCGLKFDLLPDLGRHHQAAHMGPNLLSSRPPKRGVRYYAYRLKSGRLSRPRFKKGLGSATFRLRNRDSAALKKRIQVSKSLGSAGFNIQPPITDLEALGKLAESQCSSVAKILFSEVQKTKPRPNNLDILAAARSTCCKVSLKALLEGKYGVLPEHLYLKAARLCSEHNIRVQWHQDGFICPRGCKSFKDSGLLLPLTALPKGSAGKQLAVVHPSDHENNEWKVDECHYVIDLQDFLERPRTKVTVMCDDVSFGKESIPVTCVVDEDMLVSLNVYAEGQVTNSSMPWESFTYITRPLLNQFHNPYSESSQLGCTCAHETCCPGRCDHVYLFDNDFEDARDIYGKPMHGRFPYDDKGRIILEEGYLVYECNDKCGCSKTCPNRVLQNGIRVKLEVFKTKNKGWALRAGEPILRGTFVCEYIGEVLDEHEANERRGRYGEQWCSYMYDIGAHTNDMSRLIEGQVKYVIDATKYGNVSRFINHSCLPNLVNHQVLVNSMDAQGAHIGLYASRDIAFGEELTFDYCYNLVLGEGYPCRCGTSKCKGRLY